MDTKSVIIGVIVTLLVVGGIVGIVFISSQSEKTPQNETQQLVNESEVPQPVNESRQGAGELKKSFTEEYDYENSVTIRRDGQVFLQSEMRGVALLYSEVAADNPDMGSLTIHANGVAIAHGNGDIKEEAMFKNVRFESTD